MNKAFIHKGITQTLQQVTESVMLSDWRMLSKEQIVQDVARLRSIKAQYVTTHLTHRLELHREMLSPLDQALIALYVLLDTLEGRDPARQQALYHALLEAQTPLLLACSLVPSVGEVQVSEDDAFLQIAERSANGSGQEESLGSERESIQQDAIVPDLAHASSPPSQEESTSVVAEEEVSSGSSTWFRWTEEREHQLKETIMQLVGSLDRVDMAVIKQIAAQHDWPKHSIEYKVRRLRIQQSPREAQQEKEAATEDTAKEGD
jgi:hypothetical protein